MNYKTRSEKELAEANLLPKGEYPFEIIDAREQQSKAGNDMLVLEIDLISTETGARRRVTDYIVPGSIWADKKLHDLMWSIGLGEKYAAGSIAADELLNKSGVAGVGIDKGKPFTAKDGTQKDGYDKNKIEFYKRAGSPAAATGAKAQPTAAQLANQADTLDEDVPF